VDCGGFDYVNRVSTREQKSFAGKIGGIKGVFNRTEDSYRKMKEAGIRGIQTSRNRGIGVFDKSNRLKGVNAAQTEEAKEKRSTSMRVIHHQKGEKNSQFGTKWITNRNYQSKDPRWGLYS
jgi:hypothetical protein